MEGQQDDPGYGGVPATWCVLCMCVNVYECVCTLFEFVYVFMSIFLCVSDYPGCVSVSLFFCLTDSHYAVHRNISHLNKARGTTKKKNNNLITFFKEKNPSFHLYVDLTFFLNSSVVAIDSPS